MYRNEYDIEELCSRARHYDGLAPYAQYLLDWVRLVNANSDGWSYWTAGRAAGNKLADLLFEAINGGVVSTAKWNTAIGGIKTAATRQLRHGNDIPVPSPPTVPR